jgi:cell division protein FtsB
MIHRRANQPSWWSRLIRSRLMISINLLLIGFVGWSLAHEVNQGGRVSSDYQDLEKQITSLEKQNQDYSDVINKLGTSGFVEREARVKLGYQKPGEQVLMIKDAASAAVAVSAGDDSTLSNPQKWWRYFFGDH